MTCPLRTYRVGQVLVGTPSIYTYNFSDYIFKQISKYLGNYFETSIKSMLVNVALFSSLFFRNGILLSFYTSPKDQLPITHVPLYPPTVSLYFLIYNVKLRVPLFKQKSLLVTHLNPYRQILKQVCVVKNCIIKQTIDPQFLSTNFPISASRS